MSKPPTHRDPPKVNWYDVPLRESITSLVKTAGGWLIPKLISPNDAFWGGEKDVFPVGKPIELARVKLDLPSFFTIELSQNSGMEADYEIEVGIGRSLIKRLFSTVVANGSRDLIANDPLFQFSYVNAALIGQPEDMRLRIRCVVWGTSIRVQATRRDGNTAELLKKTTVSVTPGAGAVMSANISGFYTPLSNADTAFRYDLAQSAVSQVFYPTGNFAPTRGMTIYNNSASDLYIRVGSDLTNASATDFSVRIPPNTTWEMPFPFVAATPPTLLSGIITPLRITGVWAAAGAGQAQVTLYTDLTP